MARQDRYAQVWIEAMDLSDEELLSNTAFHEAGHAVMGWWLDRYIKGVSIDLESPGEGICGDTSSMEKFQLSTGVPVPWSDVEGAIQVCLAGPLAEMRYRHLPCRGILSAEGSEDTQMAWDILTLWDKATGRSGGESFVMSLIQRDIRQFLRRPKTWTAVQALARAVRFQGYVDGEEMIIIIEQAYGRRHSRRLRPLEEQEWSIKPTGPLLDYLQKNAHREGSPC